VKQGHPEAVRCYIELSPYLQSENIALRLLPLARSAWGGERAALSEILTLSFEYHDELALFDRAVRSLFPPSLSPVVYRRYPESSGPGAGGAGGTLLFLKELQARLPEAEPRPGLGWALDLK
jgi:hypothetical protein